MELKINEYGSIEWSEKEVAGVVQIEKKLSHNDIDNIMVTAIEGGIGYWAKLDNTGDNWESRPKGVASSQWCTKLLLEGKGVKFEEDEDNTVHFLTLPKLLEGFRLNAMKRPWDSDLEQGDATTADCIIQYALFGKLIYG